MTLNNYFADSQLYHLSVKKNGVDDLTFYNTFDSQMCYSRKTKKAHLKCSNYSIVSAHLKFCVGKDSEVLLQVSQGLGRDDHSEMCVMHVGRRLETCILNV